MATVFDANGVPCFNGERDGECPCADCADLRAEAAWDDAAPEMEVCPRCSRPAHASESTDTGEATIDGEGTVTP